MASPRGEIAFAALVDLPIAFTDPECLAALVLQQRARRNVSPRLGTDSLNPSSPIFGGSLHESFAMV
jgi:hypothetical protein